MDRTKGPPDAVLLERFAVGDVAAFEALVVRYEKPVFNIEEDEAFMPVVRYRLSN